MEDEASGHNAYFCHCSAHYASHFKISPPNNFVCFRLITEQFLEASCILMAHGKDSYFITSDAHILSFHIKCVFCHFAWVDKNNKISN